MKRAIVAIAMALGLSLGCALAPPVQAQTLTETLTASVRTNSIETGQIITAPVGAVFTLTVHDVGLQNGVASVKYTVKEGDTPRVVARRLVNKINAKAKLQAIGVTATLGKSSNYTIASASPNATTYTQSATGGGVNTIAIQETVKLLGSPTAGDVLTVTVHDAGLPGGSQSVSYTVKAGDELSTIVIRLKNRINNNINLQALGISAKVSQDDAKELLIQSTTYDTFGRITSYSTSTTPGATEIMLLGAFFGTNGQQIIRVGGTITGGDVLSFQVVDAGLPAGQESVSYSVDSGDSHSTIACGLSAALNGNVNLSVQGISATCSDGDVQISSTSSNLTAFAGNFIFPPQCTFVTNVHQIVVKRCGSASDEAVENTIFTLEALTDSDQSDPTQPGAIQAPYAAELLRAWSATFYVYGNHLELKDSLLDSNSGSPPLEFFLGAGKVPPSGARGATGVGVAGFSPFTVIFDRYDDQSGVSSDNLVFNKKIRYTVAHETGHHLDAIYFEIFGGDSVSRSFANGQDFTDSLLLDGNKMNMLETCRFQATDGEFVRQDPPQNLPGFYASSNPFNQHEPLNTGGLAGLFTDRWDSNGNPICNDRVSNYNNTNLGIIQDAYHGVKADGSNTDGFFKVIYSSQEPGELEREMFAEEYAYLVGFRDTFDDDGEIVPGHDYAFDEGGNPPTGPLSLPGTAQRIFVCSGLHVSELAREGSLPDSGKLSLFGYSVPETVPQGAPFDAGMRGYGERFHACDGTVSEVGFYSFGT